MIDGVLNGYYHTQVIVITMHRVAQEDDKRGTQQTFPLNIFQPLFTSPYFSDFLYKCHDYL